MNTGLCEGKTPSAGCKQQYTVKVAESFPLTSLWNKLQSQEGLQRNVKHYQWGSCADSKIMEEEHLNLISAVNENYCVHAITKMVHTQLKWQEMSHNKPSGCDGALWANCEKATTLSCNVQKIHTWTFYPDAFAVCTINKPQLYSMCLSFHDL